MEEHYQALLKDARFAEAVADLFLSELLPVKSLTLKQKFNWEQRWKRITTTAEREFAAQLAGYFDKQRKAVVAALGGGEKSVKGDLPGHPFRGNQYTTGQGESSASLDFKEGKLLHSLISYSRTGPALSENICMLLDSEVDIGDIASAAGKDIPAGESGKWEAQRKREVEKLKEYSQKTLTARGFPPTFYVYRGGDPRKEHSIIPVSASKKAAMAFTDYGVRSGEEYYPLYKYEVRRSDVLVDVRSVREAFAEFIDAPFADEDELLVSRDSLKLVSITYPGRKKSVTKAKFDYRNWEFDFPFWQEMLQKYGGEFVQDMYQQIGKEVFNYLRYVSGNPSIVGAFDVKDPNVQEFIDTYSYQFAEGIMETTIDDLKAAISSGMDEGLDMGEIADRIEESSTFSPERAMLIARTETIRASNYAAIESYKQSGVVTKKEWLVTQDDRLCAWCAQMQGVQIDLDETFFDKDEEFSIGEGDEEETITLDYEAIGGPPLHPNCRCTLVPVIDEDILSREEQEGKRGLAVIMKGDLPGHPFRGNQYTEGIGGDVTESHGERFGIRKREANSEYAKKMLLASGIPKGHFSDLKIEFVQKTLGGGPMSYEPVLKTLYVNKKEWMDGRFSNYEDEAKHREQYGIGGWVSPSIGDRYGVSGKGDLSGRIMTHMITHEIGHHVFNKMSDTDRAAVLRDKKIQSLRTPTTDDYDMYVAGMRSEGRESPILERKPMIERVAEAYRLYYLGGVKFSSLSNLFAKKSIKGGVGSGEPEGHPFRGNQYTDRGGSSEGVPKEDQRHKVDSVAQQWMDDRGIDKNTIISALASVPAEKMFVKIEKYGLKNNAGIHIEAHWRSPGDDTVSSMRIELLEKGAYWHSFQLDDRYHKHGSAEKIMQSIEDAARKAGIPSIKLKADISIGQYAWARLGFDFENKGYINIVHQMLQDYTVEKAAEFGIKIKGSELRNQIMKLKTAEDVAKFTLPGFDFDDTKWQTGNLNVPEDMRMHLGKAFMLDNSGKGLGSWDGIKELKSKATKGGPGSGEPEGHPFRGNQYTEGTTATAEAAEPRNEPSGLTKLREDVRALRQELSNEGTNVRFMGADGKERDAIMEPRRLRAHMDALQLIKTLPQSVRSLAKTFTLCDQDMKMREHTVANRTFEEAGHWDIENREVVAKVYDHDPLHALAHETGHTEFDILVNAAKEGIDQVYMESGAYSSAERSRKFWDLISKETGNIKDPKTTEQRAFNFVNSELRVLSEKVGWMSNYAQSWANEKIFDGGAILIFKEETDKPQYDSSGDLRESRTYTSTFGTVHRSQNENYAEISRMQKNIAVEPPFPFALVRPEMREKVQQRERIYNEAQELLKELKVKI